MCSLYNNIFEGTGQKTKVAASSTKGWINGRVRIRQQAPLQRLPLLRIQIGGKKIRLMILICA
jgi:hypothetical protein